LAVARRNTGGKLVETGVFRVSAFESEMMIGLAANDEYWGGQPFPDYFEIRIRINARESWADLGAGRADLVEGN
jgi:ABC-type transport system substrate-binding protein